MRTYKHIAFCIPINSLMRFIFLVRQHPSNIGLTREPLTTSFYYDRITLSPTHSAASRVEAIVRRAFVVNLPEPWMAMALGGRSVYICFLTYAILYSLIVNAVQVKLICIISGFEFLFSNICICLIIIPITSLIIYIFRFFI